MRHLKQHLSSPLDISLRLCKPLFSREQSLSGYFSFTAVLVKDLELVLELGLNATTCC
jgi:hypothetical protein